MRRPLAKNSSDSATAMPWFSYVSHESLLPSAIFKDTGYIHLPYPTSMNMSFLCHFRGLNTPSMAPTGAHLIYPHFLCKSCWALLQLSLWVAVQSSSEVLLNDSPKKVVLSSFFPTLESESLLWKLEHKLLISCKTFASG